MHSGWPKLLVGLSIVVSCMGAPIGSFGTALPKHLEAKVERGRLSAMQPPTQRNRILVFAPHSDDETVACGGELALAVKAGAHVKVVLVSNGDGFRWAAQRFFNEREVSKNDYLKLAGKRQKETLAALSKLGLSRKQVIFLGYPDGGATPMWYSYWSPDHPYTNPRTRYNHNPYSNSLRPGIPYCGRNLIDDLKMVIVDFRPTCIFLPHPNDNHPDHRMLYCYVLGALHELGMLEKLKLKLYLVHRRGWPSPRGLHQDLALTPPLEFSDSKWQALALDGVTVHSKLDALKQYQSQLSVEAQYLFSFARRNELFASDEPSYVAEFKHSKPSIDGDIKEWEEMPAIALGNEPPGMKMKPDARGDITSMYAGRYHRSFYIRLDFAGPVSPEIAYYVNLHWLFPGKVGPPIRYQLNQNQNVSGIACKASGHRLEISLPLEENVTGVMLEAETKLKNKFQDSTRWVLLRFPHGALMEADR